MGLGEIFVLGFFGLVATCGSAYVEGVRIRTTGFLVVVLASIAVGLLAAALLQANNIRDIAGDTEAGKRTLAVRLGRRDAGFLYLGTLLTAAVFIVAVAAYHRPFAGIAIAAVPLAVGPSRLALGDAEGRELLPMLAGTARLQLCVGALLALGILV
jgi:1,4-dihydroxy-2-naphthoate octaprenyltransferase